MIAQLPALVFGGSAVLTEDIQSGTAFHMTGPLKMNFGGPLGLTSVAEPRLQPEPQLGAAFNLQKFYWPCLFGIETHAADGPSPLPDAIPLTLAFKVNGQVVWGDQIDWPLPTVDEEDEHFLYGSGLLLTEDLFSAVPYRSGDQLGFDVYAMNTTGVPWSVGTAFFIGYRLLSPTSFDKPPATLYYDTA